MAKALIWTIYAAEVIAFIILSSLRYAGYISLKWVYIFLISFSPLIFKILFLIYLAIINIYLGIFNKKGRK